MDEITLTSQLETMSDDVVVLATDNVQILDMGSNAPVMLPFSGMWAVDPATAFYLVDMIRSLSASDIVALQARGLDGPTGTEREKPYKTYDGVAHLPVTGLMTKRPAGCMDAMMNGPGTSMINLRSMLREAERDPTVQSMLLVVDSPGGEVSGVFDAANDVIKASKPVDTFYEDMGCSAAVALGSGGRRVTANSNAAVGSVGVYTSLTDRSVMNERMGARVHVVKAGRHKAIGHPGSQVTDEQIEKIQERVNAQHGLFLRHMVNARPGMTKAQLADIADASVYIGAQAKKIGLIDDITDLDGAHRQAIKANQAGTRRVTMVKDSELQAYLSGETLQPDTDTTTITTVVDASQVPIALVQNPMLTELTRMGVTSVEDLKSLAQDALSGRAHLSAIRDKATKLAITRFKDGTAIGEAMYLAAERYIASAPLELVEATAMMYETEVINSGLAASKDTGITRRFSAPGRLDGVAVDVDSQNKTPDAVATYANNAYGSHIKNGKGD